MTAIASAISALGQSLENLEKAAASQEQKVLKARQHDLFNGKPVNGNSANGHKMVDPAVLAKKLDVTIERIEQVLREG